ncbi:MAG: ABC transporter permease [Acidimicrobiales bacterium]
MFKIVRRGIAANLGRLVLTLISVVLGVAFVSGSFVLADSLRSIFDNISETAFAGVDAAVRAVEPDLNSSQDLLILRFDESVIGEIDELSTVDFSEGGLFAPFQTYSLKANGELNETQGGPIFTASWGGPSPVSSFRLVEGTAPVGQQVALDAAQVTAGGFSVGEKVQIALPTSEPEEFELSAIIEFGEGGAAGAFFNLFDLPTTQRILDAPGEVDSIVVSASSGTSTPDLVQSIEQILGSGLEVVPGQTLIDEQQEDFGEFIDIFGNVLLGFAVVVLFVSTFIIYNTFAILVGQRTRQLGLLRSIGASGPQIRAMVLIESVIIGLIASVVGLFGGIGIASLLKLLFDSAGDGTFPDGPLEILPRTIVVVIIVGMVVTVASALIPAIRASRVAPLEAIRDGGRKERSMTFRLVAGALVLLPGLLLLFLGMFRDGGSTSSRLTSIGLGAALTFIGVSMLSALFAGPASEVLGAPAEAIKGVTGRLARENASRNPQRTAATSTALMIGLALITGVAVLTASILATFDELLDEAITADLFIFEENQGLEFSATLVDQLDALSETDLVAGFAEVEARIGPDVSNVAAIDTRTGTRVINYGLTEGTSDLGVDGIAVFTDTAEEQGLALGDSVAFELEDGFVTTLEIKGLFDDNSIIEQKWIVNRDLTSDHVNIDLVGFIGLTFPEGVDVETARATVEELTGNFPQLTVQDNTEFQDSVEGQISQLQVVINGLLVLCLIVAFFGIVNTMALSVLERTREIGLLRAVGMTRRQLRSTIRWEAVVVSLFGAVLGVLMGLLLGWSAVVAIPDSFISKVGIPWVQLGVYVVVGGVMGVIAAYFPARRAAKLNVLDAISYE